LRPFFTILGIAVLAVAGWLAWALLSPVTPPGQQFVMLRPGYGGKHIAKNLKSSGVIRSEFAFRLWQYLHRGRSLKAGEYLFERPADSREVFRRIENGDVYIRTVSIPEGFTMFDIALAVQEAGLGSGENFLKAAQSHTELVSDLAPGAKTLEGYLFPDTYQFTRTQSMTDLVASMVKRFRQVATELGLSNDVQKTVTMASIVEKETAVAQERPEVASVYYNRLARNIALDADPTIIYGEMLLGIFKGPLRHEDMQLDSLYNTYRHPGLPPGPIANPGREALAAAMHPAQTDYLYFVADGAGGHRFSRSLEEHNRNIELLRKSLKQQ
jgi:UPF0755 protein